MVNTMGAIVTVRWKPTEQTPDLRQKSPPKPKKIVDCANKKCLRVAVAAPPRTQGKLSEKEYIGGAPGTQIGRTTYVLFLSFRVPPPRISGQLFGWTLHDLPIWGKPREQPGPATKINGTPTLRRPHEQGC